MRDQADVVIIGGGIFGASIAYHLTKAGCTDIVLVEKGELTSGTTFHSVGLVSQFRSSPALMQVMNYTIKLFNELRDEVGDGLGWHQTGSLRLASSSDRLKALQREVGRAKAIGMDAGIISAAEAVRLCPHISDENLFGAVHIPEDGYIDPNGITLELSRQARKRGAEILTNVRVTGIELSPAGQVSKVITDQGSIRTECVVNAAGEWAPRIAGMVGVLLPIVPLMHQFLTTKPIPGHELPRNTLVVRDPDNLVYIREEVGGFLVGGFETNPKAWSVEGVPWEFSQQLLNPEWELFEPLMEGAIRRVPILAEAEILHLVNGPDGFTPDGHYCLGPVPELRGFYVAAGGSINGIAGAGGVGKIMAEWILEGKTSIDTYEMNVRRFGPHYSNLNYLTECCREVYRYYYHLRYPGDENEGGRPLRMSPFYHRLTDLGAVFGHKNGWERVNYFDSGKPWRRAGADQSAWGWERPPYFEQVGREHEAARERVALFDMTSFGKIQVRGPGALALLQKLAANQLDKPVGSLTYTQFLNSAGGIESDVTIARLSEDEFRLISGTSFVSNDLGWIRMHMPLDGSVEVRDVTEAWGCLGLWGPNARRVLESVTAADVSNEAFPYLTAQAIDIRGRNVWAQRVSYAGELGWELYVQPEDALAVWDVIMAAGQPFGIQPAGYKALDSLRIEKGYRYWSGDISPSDNPCEAGLGFCVKLDKGDFIGREALIRIKGRGLQRKLCALLLDGASILCGGEPIIANGSLIDRVRTGAFGYTIGKTVGLAYLPIALAKEGTEVEVEIFGKPVPARVAMIPLVDPEGERLHA